MTAARQTDNSSQRSDSGSPLRIGIDIRPAQLTSGSRGIGRYIYDLAEALSQSAPENEYLLLALPDVPVPERFAALPACCRAVPLPTHQLGHLPYISQRYRWDKIPPIWAIKCAWNRFVNARAVRELVRRERLDILQFTSLFEPTYFVDGKYPCPAVKTFHDAIPLAMHGGFMAHWSYQIRAVYRQQMGRLVSDGATLVAISESARQDAARFMEVPPSSAKVIHNSVAESFQPVQGTARLRRCRETYGLGDRPFVLFCSGGGQNKNREGAVRAFARFFKNHTGAADFSLVIAGPRGGDEASLRSLAELEGLPADRFLLTGFVSDEDLTALFSAAFALLTPSFYEGFGLPAAQAMKIGLPVVAGRASSLPEVVGDAGLLVDPADIDGLAEALGKLVDDPDLRADLIERGKIRAARYFNPRRQARAYIDLYRSLVAAEAAA